MTPTALATGEQIAPGYEAIRHLERRAGVDRYEAWSHERGARCWVRVLAEDDDRLARGLLAEGRLLERLTHPHILRGYETIAAPQPVIAYERPAGETLDHLTGSGPLGVRELAYLGLHVGAALHYLHGGGLFHMELVPARVVAESGRAKLIDLGAAGAGDSAPAGDAATDVWGLGALLAGVAGGPGGEALVEVIETCLDRDPQARPALPVVLAQLEEVAVQSPGKRRFARFATDAPTALVDR